MLILNLQRVFALRGIEKPYTELVKCGISRPTAHNLLSLRVTSIKYSHMENICELLNCEPNDLFEWKPSKTTLHIETHPLKSLKRDDSAQKFSEMIKTIPLDKLSKFESVINELNSE
jgi:DNA-binding Xre family transcriptional regulator